MRTIGLSVPEVVREVITRNRSIYDCMKMDLINYTALAVKIQPEVEKQLGNSVNLNTIVVAIKRYADSFEQKDKIQDQAVLKNARLSLTDRMMDIKFSTSDSDEHDSIDFLEKFSQVTKDYDLFKLPGSFRLLTEDLEDVRRLIQSNPHTQNLYNTGLVRIKITISRENRTDVGSYVVELLHKNGIEFVDAYFSQGNMIITFDQNDASKAYDILRSEIARQ